MRMQLQASRNDAASLTRDIGGSVPRNRLDVPFRVQLDLAVQELGCGLVADGKEKAIDLGEKGQGEAESALGQSTYVICQHPGMPRRPPRFPAAAQPSPPGP